MSEVEKLRSRASASVFWCGIERVGEQGSTFLVQLVLARLLAPEQFGLIAMAAVFVVISSVIINAGFSRALVQKQEVTDVELSTVFYLNVAIAFVLSISLFLLSPIIASFYGEGSLSTILQVMSLGILLEGFGSVHRITLTKQLLFKKLFWISLPSTMISGVLGIVMALSGFGIWALVAQYLCVKFTTSLLLWLRTGWRPSLMFDGGSLMKLFPYGFRMAVSSILEQTFQSTYLLVIGKFFLPAEVGYFQRARSFQQYPVQSIQTIMGRVTFPLFASVQKDPQKIRSGMRKAVQISCFFIFPGMALLIAISEPLVVILIGEKWLPCVPYLKWLCLTGMIFPLQSTSQELLAALGRSDLFLRITLIRNFLIIVNFAITYRFGVMAMIYGMIVISAINLLLNTHYTRKLINYGLFDQLRDVLKSIFVALFILICCLSIPLENHLPYLVGCLAIGFIVFMASFRFLDSSLKEEISGMMERFPMGGLVTRLLL